ncbi:hypothetical protein FDECE_18352, partial [Fusarium decemcellulare]
IVGTPAQAPRKERSLGRSGIHTRAESQHAAHHHHVPEDPSYDLDLRLRRPAQLDGWTIDDDASFVPLSRIQRGEFDPEFHWDHIPTLDAGQVLIREEAKLIDLHSARHLESCPAGVPGNKRPGARRAAKTRFRLGKARLAKREGS